MSDQIATNIQKPGEAQPTEGGSPKQIKINGSINGNGNTNRADEMQKQREEVLASPDQPSNKKNLVVVVILAILFAVFLAGLRMFAR